MKKLINKLTKKNQEERPARITNDTLSEHRQKILAGGKKFKYPIQYAKHKLAINTIIISLLAFLLVVIFGWWQLYVLQNSSTFAYRVTTVLPLPVGMVDGQAISYSDYLMKFRSAEYYLRDKEQSNTNTEDWRRQVDYLKDKSMRDAVADAYAVKLAKQLNIEVSDDELNNFLLQQRQSGDSEISEKTYYSVIKDYYDWSPAEYESTIATKLLMQKVAYAIDKVADASVEKVESAINNKDQPWSEIVAELSQTNSNIQYGQSGLVPINNHDDGLAAAASKLGKAATSPISKTLSGDGYFILRVLEKNDQQVNYEFIKITLQEFNKQIEQLYQDGKVDIYIKMPEVEKSNQN